MLTKNEIKFIKLLDKKKERDAHQIFIAEGSKLIKDIISCGGKVKRLFGVPSWISENATFIANHNLNFTEISESEMNKITGLSTPSPVLAIFHQPNNERIKNSSNSILILDDLRDPGNLGTIIRTADWFGIRTIICSPETVDCYNAKVIQSTMGSIIRVTIRYALLEDFILQNKTKYTFYGTFMDGISIKSIAYTQPCAFIIGNEAHGISKKIEQLIHQKIAIPGNRKTDEVEGPESLNAAIATAVVLYDWFAKQQ